MTGRAVTRRPRDRRGSGTLERRYLGPIAAHAAWAHFLPAFLAGAPAVVLLALSWDRPRADLDLAAGALLLAGVWTGLGLAIRTRAPAPMALALAIDVFLLVPAVAAALVDPPLGSAWCAVQVVQVWCGLLAMRAGLRISR